MATDLSPTSPVTPAIISSAISTGSLNSALLNALPERLDDQMLSLLRTYCESPIERPNPEPASREHFLQVMRSLSLLKRRSDDELTSEVRGKLYWAKAKHLPHAAIAYACDKGLERWEWFPTIKEFLDLAAEWSPPVPSDAGLRITARARIGREERLRFTDAMAYLERRALDQTAIDALPEKWKAIAAEKCFLWRWPDGRYTRRADMERLPEDEQAVERERLAAMFAEWVEIAEQAAGSAAA